LVNWGSSAGHCDETTKAWTGIIPEFYYDLISRIPPGMFLTIAILSERFSRTGDKFSDYKAISSGIAALITILLIGSSYALGTFISAPAKFVAMLYTSRTWRRTIDAEQQLFSKLKSQKPFESFDFSSPSKIKEQEARRLYRTVHDYLKLKDTQAKVVLPKLTAESSLCNNSAIAFLLYLIIHAFNCGWDKAISEWYLYLIGVLFVSALFWMASAKYYRAIESHVVYLRVQS
jgi:hypothetical protein